MCGGILVEVRFKATDTVFQSRKFKYDKAQPFLRPLHDLEAAATTENLTAKLGNNIWHLIGVAFVGDRIVNDRAR